MKKKRKSQSKYAQTRHPFLYKLIKGDGKIVVLKAWAKVVPAKNPVDLELLAEHVRRSIKLKGVGNTSTCSMAICTYDHADKFKPYHPVEGHVDWTYTRAFIVSKLNKQGLPSECWLYEHNDGIARLNDTKGGQKKLLKQLETDGPLTIHLLPMRPRSKKGRSGAGRVTTGRRDVMTRLSGAPLRYAVAQLGALPAVKEATAA